jgi:hypothetical protein
MDIVERLRQWSPDESTHELHEDAALKIERLREALGYYVCDCKLDAEANCEVGNWISPACGYRARKALGEKK